MAELDMSLDDIIKQKKDSGRGRGRGRGRGGRGGSGPIRRSGGRGAFRANPYALAQAQSALMANSLMFNPGAAAAMAGAAPAAPFGGVKTAGGGFETGTKLYISNLDYGVSNEDVKELFSEIGELKRCAVHYDRSGRSKGTAEVVFGKKADAVNAVNRYNNVQLDGKPMKIEMIGTTSAPAVPAAVAMPQFMPMPIVNPMAFGGRGGGRGGAGGRSNNRGRGRGGRGRGRGRGRNSDKMDITAEDLDADLDSYKTTTAKEDDMES